MSRLKVETVDGNVEGFGAKAYFPAHEARRGIVRLIGPEHVLATPCPLQKKSETMLVKSAGALARGVSAKESALAVMGRIGSEAEIWITEEQANMRKIAMMTMVLLALTVAGCNTIAGIGKDIQRGGAAIQRWAR